MRTCSLCEAVIPAARLAAVPATQLCVLCKASHDEPPLKPDAPALVGAMAEGSVGDLEEAQFESRATGGLL